MKVTIDWLKKYVDFDSTPDQLANQLTMLGLEVDGIEQLDYEFDGVVIGQITNIEQHNMLPNLRICEVDIGNGKLNLLCGAPNVEKNLKVPVALVGARLPNGQIIKNATIHGYDSPGMICFEQELGLSQHGDTVMELEPESPVGKDFKEYLSNKEIIIEIDLTPNRPDCLSVIGIAREIAAMNGGTVRKPEVQVPELEDKKIEDFLQVIIQNPENCPRYSARYIEGVKIEPSPRWLAQKLEAVGIRSINNVVDVTNFVMMETGQPLHAFDYDLIQGGKIIVKNAQLVEKFTTLDEREHDLSNTNLMICDAEKPVALAGVMGGLNSEVVESTNKILLESAYFNPLNIRKSSKMLGIFSDSSQRFERGVDPEGIIYALNRATQLIIQIAGGKAAKGFIDNYVKRISPVKIPLRINKVNKILGANLSPKYINQVLNALGFETRMNTDVIEVHVPTFRPDINREEDLVEEVARIYGYDNFAEKTYASINLLSPKNNIEKFTDFIREISVGIGYNEVLTNTLINATLLENFSEYEPVEIKNPLNEELSALRTNLIPCLLQVANWNLNRRIQNLRLFEIGNIFHWKEKSVLHEEQRKISFVLTGVLNEDTWLNKFRPIDFFDLKGDIETFLSRINIGCFNFVDSKRPFFDYRNLEIISQDRKIGFLGAIRKDVLSKFDIDQEIFAAQLNFQDLLELRNWEKKFTAIPKFPSIKRDLSILVDSDLVVKDIYSEIWKFESDLLKSVHLFDLYRGKQIERGKKSLTFSLIFYSTERTLTETEVDEIINQIMKALETNLNAQLRK